MVANGLNNPISKNVNEDQHSRPNRDLGLGVRGNHGPTLFSTSWIGVGSSKAGGNDMMDVVKGPEPPDIVMQQTTQSMRIENKKTVGGDDLELWDSHGAIRVQPNVL